MNNHILPFLLSSTLAVTLFSCEESREINPVNIQQKTEISQNEQSLNSSQNKKTKIKLAIILDTSNSMDGLINQAKNQLWKIVTELAKTKDKNGEDPDIDLALYQYGNSSLSLRTGYIQLIQNFTGELDEISEKLFALKTNGGEEYCGAVINSSISDLEWSNSPDDLQMIYIAGNEGFNQGSFNYQKACEIAKSRHVTVNTIFCGPRQKGINTFWKHGADLTKGNFACIDSDAKSVHYNSPFDDQISSLNKELNKTYVPFNASGHSKKKNQLMQDSNAESFGKANASKRYLSKGSKVYRNSSWDLVDYSERKHFDINQLDKNHLPDSLKNLSNNQLEIKINQLSNHRKKVKHEMAKLNKKREDFIAKEKVSHSEVAQLESAIIKGLKEQASKKKIRFEETIN